MHHTHAVYCYTCRAFLSVRHTGGLYKTVGATVTRLRRQTPPVGSRNNRPHYLSLRPMTKVSNFIDPVNIKKGKGSPYSITQRRVPELISVLGSQLAGDLSHKPGGRLPLLSARPAVTLATLKRAATNFAAW